MSRPRVWIDDAVRRELEASGLPWRTENGKKHGKIYLGDRLVAIMPHGSRSRDIPRITASAVAHIRKAIREHRA
jgi:hypothetical protein